MEMKTELKMELKQERVILDKVGKVDQDKAVGKVEVEQADKVEVNMVVEVKKELDTQSHRVIESYIT